METNLEEDDYVLVDNAMWLRVNGFAIWIRKTSIGVKVEIFDNNFVMCGAMSAAEAFDDDLALEGNPWVDDEENDPIDLDGGLSATNEQDDDVS